MIGIIGAMREEIEILQKSMLPGKTTKAAQYEFCEGTLHGKEVILLRCGIGKVSSAVGCALLIDRFKPDLVINTGSAGGINPNLVFGDAVIADSLLYHDVDVTAFGYALGQVPGMSPTYPVEESYIGIAETAIKELVSEGVLPKTFKSFRGMIASSDSFMSDTARVALIRERFPDVDACDMESASIAQTCSIMTTPFIVIRALSDIAGAESPVKFDEFLPIAAKHSAAIVERIIAHL
jgi:adenosylhomocysteine nucleosidase